MIEEVAAAVARAKNNDPLAEVLVVMPTGVAAGSALNDMARRGGVFNVQFKTLEFLARYLIGASYTVPRLRSTMKHELVRLLAAQARAPLSVYTPDVLAASLVEVFDDLDPRSEPEIEQISQVSPLTFELVRLYRLFRAQLAGRYASSADILQAATRAVEAGGPCPRVVIAILEPPGAYETELFAALNETGKLELVTVGTGDALLDSAIEPWLWGLDNARALREPQPVDRIVVAPDADTEVQLAISELLRQAEAGVAFSEMALLYSTGEPYGRIIEDQMRAAGVPIRGYSSINLSQTVAGTFVMRLFDVVETSFSFASVASWLLGLGNDEAAEWLHSARKARVSGGPAKWIERLRARETDVVAQRFADFLVELEQYLSTEANNWQTWTEWLQAGIEKYLGNFTSRKWWTRFEADLAVKVEERVSGLMALDEVSQVVSQSVFMDALRAELESHRVRHKGRSGVLVGSIGESTGCDFQVTVICGLAEGVFPRSSQRDGLLASLVVPGEESRADRDRRTFALRTASDGFRMLTVAAADVRAQRPMRPSVVLLNEAAKLAGRTVDSAELMHGREEWPWLQVFSSFTQVLAAPQLQLSSQLDDVAALQQHVMSGGDCVDSEIVVDAETFRSGIEVLRNRDSDNFTRHDGFVGGPVSLGGAESEPLTPTALETWARCPFKYLAQSVLKVDYEDEDESVLAMSPRDRGSLVHDVLETFINQMAPRTSPDQRWTEDERAQLKDIVDAQFRVAVRKGTAPQGFTTDVQRKGLQRQLDILLTEDENMRRAFNVTPVAVEQKFGIDSPAVAMTAENGVPVWFKGRIDRIDASADGSRVVVTDYKTGKAKNSPAVDKDPLANGRALQLAIYAKAAQRLYPEAAISSGYWFVSDEASGYERAGIQFDEATQTRAQEVFGHMHRSFENGAFPAVPGEEDGRTSFKNCRSCPYDAVCPRDRSEAFIRKSQSDRVQPYIALTEEA